LATEVDSIVALGVAAGISATLIIYEALHLAEARRRIREASAHPGR
jgi:hypothetical protein